MVREKDPAAPGLSLYIHIPFCRQKCSYCDFASWPGKMDRMDAYVEGLVNEIEFYRGVLAGWPVSTIFFGGGTPTLLKADQVNLLLSRIFRTCTLAPDVEISMEANPEGLGLEYLKALKDAGINRLSIGLQSTHDDLLRFLGRRHSAADFFRGVELAQKAGFTNLSADLIFGIPGQTPDHWRQSLAEVAGLRIPHLSCYGLTYEEGTPLTEKRNRKEFVPVEEDSEWEMYRFGIEWLQKQGYEHYEISNYALPGSQCRHNLTYWENREYLGLGAAAHGFVAGRRYENEPEIEKYLDRVQKGQLPVAAERTVTLAESVSETCFLGLRLRRGISEKQFLYRYGKTLQDFFPEEIPHLINRGLLVREKEWIRLSDKGLDLANLVFEALFLEEK